MQTNEIERPGVAMKDKVALVTGAARRIGAVIARELHAAGASVGIHGHRSVAAAESLAESLNRSRADSARVFRGDLTQVPACEQLADSMLEWSDAVDVLVNNASAFYPTPIGSITETEWEELVGSNLKAPLFLTQALVPTLRQRAGCVINIVDIHARRPLRDHSVYGASKAGLEMLTRSLAKDLAPDIRVNGISPGAILWPEQDMPQDTKDSIIKQVPLGRPGDPLDIARCALFLAGDAPYVTGQVIAVDGGRSLGW